MKFCLSLTIASLLISQTFSMSYDEQWEQVRVQLYNDLSSPIPQLMSSLNCLGSSTSFFEKQPKEKINEIQLFFNKQEAEQAIDHIRDFKQLELILEKYLKLSLYCLENCDQLISKNRPSFNLLPYYKVDWMCNFLLLLNSFKKNNPPRNKNALMFEALCLFNLNSQELPNLLTIKNSSIATMKPYLKKINTILYVLLATLESKIPYHKEHLASDYYLIVMNKNSIIKSSFIPLAQHLYKELKKSSDFNNEYLYKQIHAYYQLYESVILV